MSSVMGLAALYEEGLVVKAVGFRVRGSVVGLERGSSLYCVLGGRPGWMGGSLPVAHLRRGPSCGQSRRGACRSEGLVAGEHVPDGLGELAGDVDARDLLAALAAQALGGALVALAVDR